MRNSFFIRMLLILFLSPISVAQASSSATESNSSAKQCQFLEVYQSDGWSIPGLSDMKGKESQSNNLVPLTDSQGHQMATRARFSNAPGVFITELTPEHGGAITVPICSADHPGRLLLRRTPIAVLKLWRFDFEGKVFAYALQYEPNPPSLTAGYVFFYDSDGSGLFKVAKYPARLFLSSLEIPEWVKEAR